MKIKSKKKNISIKIIKSKVKIAYFQKNKMNPIQVDTRLNKVDFLKYFNYASYEG
jgi:hypothetical protein